MLTPQELQAELDGIPDPPEVSDLLSGSGVSAMPLNTPCSEVNCEEVAAALAQVQQWLDEARERLKELNDYTDMDALERIRNEAQRGKNEVENSLGDNESDGSGYQDIVDAANEKLRAANDLYNELAQRRETEAQTKNALLQMQNHCCVEPGWWTFFFG